jgi:hypothetical protein
MALRPQRKEQALKMGWREVPEQSATKKTRGYDLSRNPFISLVPRDGIERPTRGFSARSGAKQKANYFN